MREKEAVKVVVVDDVADAAHALAMLLKLEGCDVATATSSELLRHRYADEIVLIAVTGGDPEQARVANTFAIVDHYFQKPIDAKKLAKLLSGPTATGPADLPN
jgi:DNA-binding response OmpR family regulator